MTRPDSCLTAATPYYQTAYVTTDFDRALDILKTTHGLADFLIARDVAFAIGQGRTATVHMAVAWRGDTQYELLQAVGGDADIYRRGLPEDGSFGMCLHHLCQEVSTERELHDIVARLRAAGVPLAVEHGLEGLTEQSLSAFIYADFTETLGHYVEIIHFTEAGRQFIGQAPRFPTA